MKTAPGRLAAGLAVAAEALYAFERPAGGMVATGGWKAWWASLSIESPLEFAALTVVIVVLVGATLGFLTDAAISRLGIDLRSRDLAER